MRSLVAFIRSFGYAFVGLGTLVRTQRNARVHVLAVAVVLVAGWQLRLERGEWLAVAVVCALVLALEAVNTAIEAVVDLVSPAPHPLAKRAKDVAAAAVLIAAMGALAVAALLVVPRL
ncbi:MAG TPA: diacylglycerol kinase family protein [Herpetosiphonaceae bacterium]